MSQPLVANFVDPEAMIRQLTVEPGALVADFGCGSGYFSISFARAVGKEGKVYAFDILPSALESISSRAKVLGLTNITPKRANLERQEGSGLPSESVDWVILKDVLFQNKNKDTMVEEVARVLKKSGQAVVMEWKVEADATVGPETSLRLSREALVTLLEKYALTVKQDLAAGDFHYAFVVGK